ncbi:unnamed protein product [Effrenium voratum]|uniref:Uncharacterized protein n=1 Tax=Effrenium voratum TaxID=2562239 RepID=A0AA36JF48_9DINO|nr:unnamed protein product [Effrenium voratum]
MYSHFAEHFIEPWSAELSQSPVKIAGQLTLACWQNCECVAGFSISCARGVCLLACVAVACVQDMLHCSSVRDALPTAHPGKARGFLVSKQKLIPQLCLLNDTGE